tara:strand:+ start:612 stop:1388 length:777 start_codon:yes stop_codon:yes gene_type:complete
MANGEGLKKWGGALIGAAGSIGSSVISNSGGRKSQERANEHNVNFWNMQNEYNSPTSQMQRLREAGLNPNMLYGGPTGTAAGNAEKIAPAKAAPVQFNNPVPFAQQVGNTAAQTDNLKTQNTVLIQEALLKAAQIGELGIKTSQSKFDLTLAKELRENSVDASKLVVDQLRQNLISSNLDNTFKDKTLSNRIENIAFGVDQAKATLKGTKLTNALNKAKLELRQMGIETTDDKITRILTTNKGSLLEYFNKYKNKRKN